MVLTGPPMRSLSPHLELQKRAEAEPVVDLVLDLGLGQVELGLVDRDVQPAGIRERDGVVGGVGVAAQSARAAGVGDWVDGDEPGGGGVVLMCADDGEADAGVGGFAEEPVAVRPGRGCCSAGGALLDFIRARAILLKRPAQHRNAQLGIINPGLIDGIQQSQLAWTRAKSGKTSCSLIRLVLLPPCAPGTWPM